MTFISTQGIGEVAYNDYMEEWEASGEMIVPMSTARGEMTFEESLENWQYYASSKAYDKGFVPASTYFLVNDYNKIIGAVNIRHELNDHLLREGGHIGYGIRPSERGHGYAKLLVKFAVEVLTDMNVHKILITCDKENTASYKTIEACGGHLENILDLENKSIRRYWIEV